MIKKLILIFDILCKVLVFFGFRLGSEYLNYMGLVKCINVS